MLRGVEEFRLLIYTLVVVLILLFLPRGVLPTVADGINSLLRKKER
jgi:ABC-type branched-subunit amino acid transport system permease subunit